MAETFSQKIKNSIKSLENFPEGYSPTGFSYRGYEIFLKPTDTYLIFYTIHQGSRTITILRVMQDRMNWKYHLRLWAGKA